MATPLLKAVTYDPGTIATASVSSLLAMTALDTTNLRATFTAPASGTVLVRGGVCLANTSTTPTIPGMMLGVLESAAVKLRMVPIGSGAASLNHTGDLIGHEFYGIVSGLTVASHNFDLAYSVDIVGANVQAQWGGPNDATGNDAGGAAWIEVYDPGANYLAGTVYDPPGTAPSKSVASLLAMTALDTTNLRLTFTAPSSGNVFWRIRVPYTGASSTIGMPLLGILESTTVVARKSPTRSLGAAILAGSKWMLDASGVVTGVSAGSHSWDAAYAVQEASSAGGALRWGGNDDTTTNNAWGGALFELWAC